MVLKQKESKKSKTLFKSDRNRKSCFLVILSNLFLFPLPPQGKSQGSTVNSLTVNLPTHSRGNPSFESLNVIILYYYYIMLLYYYIRGNEKRCSCYEGRDRWLQNVMPRAEFFDADLI